MFTRNLLVFLICATTHFSVLAQDVPNIFVPGDPANAEDVNENFSALVNQIDALQAQIDALSAVPTMASVAGTYDFFDIGIDVLDQGNGSFAIGGSSGSGFAVLNEDGTGTLNFTESFQQLNINTETRQDQSVGTIETTSLLLNNDPDSGVESISWTLNGNTITVTSDDEGSTRLLGAGGRILVGTEGDSDGEHILIIAVRR